MGGVWGGLFPKRLPQLSPVENFSRYFLWKTAKKENPPPLKNRKSSTAKEKSSIFHAVLTFSTVKLVINVPITSAGMKILFSSLESTPEASEFTTFNFATTKPISINSARTAIWLSEIINILYSLSYILFFFKMILEISVLAKQ